MVDLITDRFLDRGAAPHAPVHGLPLAQVTSDFSDHRRAETAHIG